MNKGLFLVALMFSGCGGTTTTYSNGVVGTTINLPKCDSSHQSQIYYVQDTGELILCDGTKWFSIKGADGKDGATTSILSGFNCTKLSGGLTFHFAGITYTTGDVWVECDIANSSLQVTGTGLYKSTQVASSTFLCSITFDSDGTATSGFWTFTGTKGIRKAVYTDAGSSSNQSTMTFSSTDCTTL